MSDITVASAAGAAAQTSKQPANITVAPSATVVQTHPPLVIPAASSTVAPAASTAGPALHAGEASSTVAPAASTAGPALHALLNTVAST